MKTLALLFSLISTTLAYAQETNTELGLSTNAVSQYTFTTSFTQNLNIDLSQRVSESKSYQVGFLGSFQLTSISSALKLVATATIHFTNEEWKNAFFLRPMLGWGRDTYGSIPVTGIIYGLQVGKRFAITDALIWRPVVEFSRDTYNSAQIIFTPLSLSLFISAPQLF